jgi:hypothetical protein
MATFPENMAKLDVRDTEKSLSVIENYINYMCERTDFAMRNMTKTVSAAGISTVEVYLMLNGHEARITGLETRMAAMEGRVTALENIVGSANSGLVKAVADLTAAVGDASGGLVKDVADIKAAIGDTETSGTILYQLADLDRRVTALENE